MCLGRGSGEHPVCKGRPGQRLSRRPWVGVLEAKGPSTRQRKVGLVRPGEPKWHTRKRRQPPRYGGLGAKPRLARRDYEFSALDHGLQRHPPRLGRVLTAGQRAILPVFGPKTRAFSLPGVQRYPANSAMRAQILKAMFITVTWSSSPRISPDERPHRKSTGSIPTCRATPTGNPKCTRGQFPHPPPAREKHSFPAIFGRPIRLTIPTTPAPTLAPTSAEHEAGPRL